MTVAMELRMQYATAPDGVRIAYGTAGAGDWLVRIPSPPFVHSQMEWAEGSEFFDGLAENWSVVQFDPRGTGLSDRDVADFSFEARLLDLEAVVERLGLENFALAGIQWAGPLAVTYAVRHPERVTYLVLDDSHARTQDFMNLPQARALDQLTSDWDSFLEYLVFMAYRLGGEEARPHIAYLRGCVTQDVARRIFDAARTDDVTELLSRVTAPTLVIQHRGFMRGELGAARELAARIPNARLVMVEGIATDSTGQILRAMCELMGKEPAGRQQPVPASAPASGVRTILFTDVVEHTAIMGRLGDRAGREWLREHEELTRKVLREHGGDEVKSLGDGFMASFSSVIGAVECAIALQRAFEERNQRDDSRDRIDIRIGLNAGEPIEEGGDFFGATVIMAARIAAQAGGAEILASDVVRGLCAGKGFLFADRGESALRGFEDPVRVYEVRWRD